MLPENELPEPEGGVDSHLSMDARVVRTVGPVVELLAVVPGVGVPYLVTRLLRTIEF